ncbi:MAG: universal stress protein [Spirochaetes bacterium]|nr:universal stress protein [Spirochaetota bacterium]
MKLLDRILLATDFSPSSDLAARQAAELAEKFDSEIIPIHVIPETDVPAVTQKMIRSAAEKELEKFAARLASKGVSVRKPLLLKGAAYYHIVNQAELLDVNVICIGAGGKGPSDSIRFGTTVEKVIRKSMKPVWTVSSSGGVKKILCAVDLSIHSKRALKNAIHMARVFNADLTIMTVIKSYAGLLKGLSGDLAKSVEKSTEEKIRPKFERFLKGANFYNVRWKKVVRHGAPHQEIVNEAVKGGADLIVMGSIGEGATRLSFLGSTAEKVLRAMPASVINVKSEDAIQLRFKAEMKDVQSCDLQGRKLLSNGLAEEAIGHFKNCLSINSLYDSAYEGIAEAYSQLGEEKEAQRYRKKRKEAQKEAISRKVTAEMRSRKFRK